ncbi:CpsD/CapB family tyrosine-protein kinase [Dehalobacter sp. CF]|uniref:tyrosine-protein kinase family protein n=1 Tax=Dehalobacter sp. CF TaxID=1131462 RepID=UPI00028B3CA9|nr:CpsD/CapB family tyrosine-protein kinase [Dehalobacter sp. CF]AFV05127.1 Tyrosine-protein kinase EpsD [Dehalobacter sp. CF]
MQTKTFKVYNNENQAVQDAYEMLTACVHISSDQNKYKTFVLASCNPAEGKTSLAISLAIAMAKSGWRVLLVDADMRKPAAAKRLNDNSLNGLSDYLIGNINLSNALCETNIHNLIYLPSGNDHSNAIGLLCSVRFDEFMDKVRNDYDYILFDTPALNSVVDGAIVASKVDATLLVVEMKKTTLKAIKRVKEQLNNFNANILGVVLNKMKRRDYKRYLESYNYFFNTNRFLKNKKKRVSIESNRQQVTQ